MAQLKVRDIMTTNVVCIDLEKSVLDAARVMTEKQVGCLLVKRDDTVVGIITERDLVRRALSRGEDPSKISVASVTSQPVFFTRPNSSLEEAAAGMQRHGIRRLAVLDGSSLVGIITATDLARSMAGSTTDPFLKALTRSNRPSQ